MNRRFFLISLFSFFSYYFLGFKNTDTVLARFWEPDSKDFLFKNGRLSGNYHHRTANIRFYCRIENVSGHFLDVCMTARMRICLFLM